MVHLQKPPITASSENVLDSQSSAYRRKYSQSSAYRRKYYHEFKQNVLSVDFRKKKTHTSLSYLIKFLVKMWNHWNLFTGYTALCRVSFVNRIRVFSQAFTSYTCIVTVLIKMMLIVTYPLHEQIFINHII